MDLKRFVRVVRSDGGGGTGYLLSGDRVLTAHHVVEGATAITVHYDGLDHQRGLQAVAEPQWMGSEDLDVAVLALETNLPLARQLLAPAPVQGDQPWRTRGWGRAAPPVAHSHARIAGSMAALAGTAYEVPEGASGLQLSVEAPPDDVEWWKGVSGAPVFCGRWLVGVVRGGFHAFQGGRLDATPLTAVWVDLEFRKAVGYADNDDELRARRREELLSHLTELLAEYSDAAAAIAAEQPQWKAEYGADGAAALAEALCGTSSWRTMVQALDSAHAKAAKGGGKSDLTIHGICAVLERVLPEVYGATELQQVPGADGGQLITVPHETVTMGEIAMAAFDGRALSFKEVTSREGSPVGRAVLQPADERLEQGLDFNQEESVRTYLLHLANWLGVDREHLSLASRRERQADLAALVNLRIEADLAWSEPRRYFAYSSEFAEQHGLFLTQLRNALPALHFVELAGERTLVDEVTAYEPLHRLLLRTYLNRNPQ